MPSAQTISRSAWLTIVVVSFIIAWIFLLYEMPMPSTSKTSLPNPLRSVSDSFPPVPDFPDAAVPVSAPVSAPSEIPAPPCEPQGPKQANPAHEEYAPSDFRYTNLGGCGLLRDPPQPPCTNASAAPSQQPQPFPFASVAERLHRVALRLKKSHRLSGNGNRTRVHYLERNSALFDAERRGHSLVQMHSLPEFDSNDLQEWNRKISMWGGVVTLKEAYLTGEHAMGFDCHVTYFAGGCKAALADFPLGALRGAGAAEEVGEAVVLAQFWCTEFYHWLIEGLMRLGILYDWLQANPSVNILHCPLRSKTGGEAFFKLLRIDPARVIAYDHRKVYYGRRLLFPTATSCGEANSAAVRDRKSVV